MKFIKLNAQIIFLLAVSTFVMLHKLGTVPSGLYVDEALSGYNAYSILKTGRDEYAKSFPIAFRFFGSYSPPLYVYLTAISVKLLGLNVFSTRFVSAVAGVVMTYVFYVSLKIFKITKNKLSTFFATFVFIVSPWNILLARSGHEVYLGFLLFSMSTLLLYRAISQQKWLLMGLLLMSLSTYGAHTERFLAPLFLTFYFLFFYKKLKLDKQKIKQGLSLLLFSQLPNIYLLATPAFFSKTKLFFQSVIVVQSAKIYLPSFISYPLAFVREFFSQFVTYFSPRSLFLLGDPDFQRSAPEIGVFQSWLVIPYLVGVFLLWKERKNTWSKYLLLMLFATPFLTSITKDPFSSQRALPLLYPLSLVIGLGINYFFEKYNKKGVSVVFFGLLVLFLISLWRSYFVLLPGERGEYWTHGYKDLANEIYKRPNTKFIVDQTRQKPSYIELLFFLQYPPERLHNEVGSHIAENYYKDTQFEQGYKLSNFVTRSIVWEMDVYKQQILVGDDLAISESQAREHFLNKVFEVRSEMGEIIFVGYETNPAKKCRQNPSDVHCKDI